MGMKLYGPTSDQFVNNRGNSRDFVSQISDLYTFNYEWDYLKQHPTSMRWDTRPFWPVQTCGYDGGNMSGGQICNRGMWAPWHLGESGRNKVFFFAAGYTKNSSGTALGGAVVQVFRTSDDLLVSETASDGTGLFTAWSIYSGTNHYFVAYYPGSPDIAGTTVNTLQTTS